MSLLSVDLKKYIPIFILNLLSKLKYLLKKISPIVLFLTVISFWALVGFVIFIEFFTDSEQLINTEQPATATARPVYQVVGEARLGIDGANMKLLTIDTKGGLGKVFLFQYDDGSVATSLSVGNPAIISPEFRIIKGQKRDWLVTTTIKNWGTGFINHVDTWYDVSSYYDQDPVVLSYLSDSSLTNLFVIDGILTQKLTTDVSISADDNSIDIKFIFENCEAQDKCTKTTKVAHYVWDNGRDIFVLDEKKSEINALEISNLY